MRRDSPPLKWFGESGAPMKSYRAAKARSRAANDSGGGDDVDDNKDEDEEDNDEEGDEDNGGGPVGGLMGGPGAQSHVSV